MIQEMTKKKKNKPACKNKLCCLAKSNKQGSYEGCVHLCLTFLFIAGLKEPQFVEFNGGFGQAQLDWFSEVLKFSDENQEKVVVMGRWMQGKFGDRCKAKLCTSALVEEDVATL